MAVATQLRMADAFDYRSADAFLTRPLSVNQHT
jgi:hypothetical protein